MTQRRLRPLPDGPDGHVRVLFGYVSVAAGHNEVVKRSLTDYVAAALRHASPLQVEISVRLRDAAGHAIDAASVTALRLIR